MPERSLPDTPEEWLNRAQSSLALAKMKSRKVYYEDLCFQAQQAAEKAIKAVFISRKIVFPYIHDSTALLTQLEQEGILIPEEIKKASILTLYASQTRYPGPQPPISKKEYQDALRIAESVTGWAERIIQG
ncbi:MAG: HEPN domain-containing protein [Deltaproteobacteria bacterium]|nr:HEPN domain-containing protein [Deltaproteobacteria bacterium]